VRVCPPFVQATSSWLVIVDREPGPSNASVRFTAVLCCAEQLARAITAPEDDALSSLKPCSIEGQLGPGFYKGATAQHCYVTDE
jgi:hypothetical protein